ncbi:hypothetical protein N7448_007877 [Penicillium atrosanguineum]|uniref:DUF676 domain-containing protein n=1 Tax=Penicillium atrosanguineum TaxID=1132637 RepID=A0A9W9UDF0_9EURO|nr:uncharacterized protein N7443_001101 [Penicillium atrosanguineum]KAJ5127098.1 hypothetical protein N7448_007877 [Penicillium atrosanguineum]KAJ5147303.1 hypothetical protein N7526_000655 [Penicillium atrosanguineum]KAJ5314217.1 hypothetical protein N7443_001101 [Penicillium atrosanguineum]KAJ5331384.1 hypothetical protein N7476_001167 [Penicillium atrosanguineum]
MLKTLLVVFIHGFKGSDDTFGNFPEHLRVLVNRALPAVKVATTVYPKFETRGQLGEAVGRFREWLQNTVIDLEVQNQTASPTVDPSVHVFLVGHSMGGIVAAETLLLLAGEQPVPHNPGSDSQPGPQADDHAPAVEPGTFMFPHIQGVFAFDTPYLGIAPGVVAHGAEGHYRNATTAYNTFSEVAGLFGYGGKEGEPGGTASATAAKEPPKALTSSDDAAAVPSWQKWGRYAMFAGAAGAVAAGGAAALYSQRQNLSASVDWVSSHLAFIGCLARKSELEQRISKLATVEEERGISCVNFYTCLGKGAGSLVENMATGKTSFTQKIIRSKNRTFCALPPAVENGEEVPTSARPGLRWTKAVNNQATDEVKAHVTMFLPKENPAFFDLLSEASKTLVASIDMGWYQTSTGPDEGNNPNLQPDERAPGSDDFMDADDVVVVD